MDQRSLPLTAAASLAGAVRENITEDTLGTAIHIPNVPVDIPTGYEVGAMIGPLNPHRTHNTRRVVHRTPIRANVHCMGWLTLRPPLPWQELNAKDGNITSDLGILLPPNDTSLLPPESVYPPVIGAHCPAWGAAGGRSGVARLGEHLTPCCCCCHCHCRQEPGLAQHELLGF